MKKLSEKILLRELYLIRHGESYCNIEDFVPETFLDEHDPELSPKGCEQAQKLGKYWSYKNFDAIYTSPLRRAVMTSAGFLGDKKQSLYLMPDLCEIGISPEYNGFLPEDLKQYSPYIQFAEGYENCAKTAVSDECPWEHEERYFARAEKVLKYIEERYNGGETVALVSHAGFMTYLMFYLMGYRDNEPGYDIRNSNTGVTKISFYEPGTNKYGDMIIEYVNDRRHLV